MFLLGGKVAGNIVDTMEYIYIYIIYIYIVCVSFKICTYLPYMNDPIELVTSFLGRMEP